MNTSPTKSEKQLVLERGAQLFTNQVVVPKQQSRTLFKYAADPLGFVKDFIRFPRGKELAPYQEEILATFVEKRRLAIRSPHGAGKTMIASCLGLWGIMTHEDAKVVCTASAWRQLTKFFFPECHKWSHRIDFVKMGRAPFTKNELQTLSLKLSPTRELFAVASDRSDLIEGAHAEFILYIMDECKAIPAATWDAVEGALSTGDAYVLAISTPGNRSGRFFDIHRHAVGYESWKTEHIKIEECIAAGRVRADWVENARKMWGEDSPVFQAKVLGEFPEQAENALFSLTSVEMARDRELEIDDELPTALGADIGRFGDDDSCLLKGKGSVVLYGEIWHGNDLMASAGRIKAHECQVYKIDVIGIGSGVVDRLREQGVPVIAVGFGESPIDKEHFVNLRDESYWVLSRRFKDGDIDLTRLDKNIYDRLCGELTSATYSYTSDGKVKIMPKADWKKELGCSPDVADTLAILYSGNTGQPRGEEVRMKTQASRWVSGMSGGSRWRR